MIIVSDQQIIDESQEFYSPDLPDLGDFLDIRIHTPIPGLALVRVSGELDMLTAPVLTERVSEQIRRSSHVVVDLSGVSFMGSSGLTALVRLHKAAVTHRTQLHLAGTEDPAVTRPLAIAGLDSALDVHAGPADAVVAALRLEYLIGKASAAPPDVH